jgi:hypothetical protein
MSDISTHFGFQIQHVPWKGYNLRSFQWYCKIIGLTRELKILLPTTSSKAYSVRTIFVQICVNTWYFFKQMQCCNIWYFHGDMYVDDDLGCYAV